MYMLQDGGRTAGTRDMLTFPPVHTRYVGVTC